MQVRPTARECLRAALILQHHQLQDEDDTSAQRDLLNHILYTVDRDTSTEDSIERLWQTACNQFISNYKQTSTTYTQYELAKCNVEDTLIARANQLKRLKKAEVEAKLAAAAATAFTDYNARQTSAPTSVVTIKLESVRIEYTESGMITSYRRPSF